MTYCGYTNYETWYVALILDNDETLYNKVRTFPKETLAQKLESFVYGMIPVITPELIKWISQSFLGNVNWQEIAENILED